MALYVRTSCIQQFLCSEKGGSAKTKSGKGSAGAKAGGAYTDFSVELAKSGRAGCQGCQTKILKVCCK